MPRHNRAAPSGTATTEFSRFVRQYRMDVRRVSQDEFLEELKLTGRYDKQYLSKVETGKIRVPPEDFLRAVEAVTRKPYDELRQMCGATEAPPPPSSLTPFDLAFGHDLRSAPLYLAFWDKGTHLAERFRAASQGFVDAGRSGWAPFWIGSDQGGRDVESYAAPDVVDALMERRIDIGAFPANVLEKSQSWQEELMVLATIVNSIGPLNLVANPDSPCFKAFTEALNSPRLSRTQSKNQPSVRGESARAIDTNTLGRVMAQLASGDKFKIAVEKDTVAETALRDACACARASGAPTVNEATFGFSSRNALLLRHTFQDIANKGKDPTSTENPAAHAKRDLLLGVITWEPHATIFAQRVQTTCRHPDSNQIIKYILNRSPTPAGRPRHMSYDLIVRRESLTQRNPHYRQFRDAIIDLLTAVQAKAGYLNTNVGSDKLPGDAEDNVAEYYGLGVAERAAESLETILFDLQLSIGSLEALRAL